MRWILLALALSGCATHAAPVAVNLCLPMRQYSAEKQSAAAEELTALPNGSVLAEFVVDYGVMRAANRACLAGSGVH